MGVFWEMSESVWNQRRSGRVLLSSEGPVGSLVDAFLGAPSSSSLAARPARVVAPLRSLLVTVLLQAGWSRAQKQMAGTVECLHYLLSLEIFSLLEWNFSNEIFFLKTKVFHESVVDQLPHISGSVVAVQLLRCVLTLQPHGLHHARLPCPSPAPGAYQRVGIFSSCLACPLTRQTEEVPFPPPFVCHFN